MGKVLNGVVLIFLIALVISLILVIKSEGSDCMKQPFQYVLEKSKLDVHCQCIDDKGEAYTLNRTEFKHIEKEDVYKQQYFTGQD